MDEPLVCTCGHLDTSHQDRPNPILGPFPCTECDCEDFRGNHEGPMTNVDLCHLMVHLSGLQPPLGDLATLTEDCQRAINAVNAGRPDEVMWTEGGEPAAYAHHLVSIFDLEAWVS